MEQITHTIIKTLTSARIEAALGVSSHAVRKAYQDRRFPASWFDVMEKLCADNGLTCPRKAFNFKEDKQ